MHAEGCVEHAGLGNARKRITCASDADQNLTDDGITVNSQCCLVRPIAGFKRYRLAVILCDLI